MSTQTLNKPLSQPTVKQNTPVNPETIKQELLALFSEARESVKSLDKAKNVGKGNDMGVRESLSYLAKNVLSLNAFEKFTKSKIERRVSQANRFYRIDKMLTSLSRANDSVKLQKIVGEITTEYTTLVEKNRTFSDTSKARGISYLQTLLNSFITNQQQEAALDKLKSQSNIAYKPAQLHENIGDSFSRSIASSVSKSGIVLGTSMVYGSLFPPAGALYVAGSVASGVGIGGVAKKSLDNRTKAHIERISKDPSEIIETLLTESKVLNQDTLAGLDTSTGWSNLAQELLFIEEYSNHYELPVTAILGLEELYKNIKQVNPDLLLQRNTTIDTRDTTIAKYELNRQTQLSEVARKERRKNLFSSIVTGAIGTLSTCIATYAQAFNRHIVTDKTMSLSRKVTQNLGKQAIGPNSDSWTQKILDPFRHIYKPGQQIQEAKLYESVQQAYENEVGRVFGNDVIPDSLAQNYSSQFAAEGVARQLSFDNYTVAGEPLHKVGLTNGSFDISGGRNIWPAMKQTGEIWGKWGNNVLTGMMSLLPLIPVPTPESRATTKTLIYTTQQSPQVPKHVKNISLLPPVNESADVKNATPETSLENNELPQINFAQSGYSNMMQWLKAGKTMMPDAVKPIDTTPSVEPEVKIVVEPKEHVVKSDLSEESPIDNTTIASIQAVEPVRNSEASIDKLNAKEELVKKEYSKVEWANLRKEYVQESIKIQEQFQPLIDNLSHFQKSEFHKQIGYSYQWFCNLFDLNPESTGKTDPQFTLSTNNKGQNMLLSKLSGAGIIARLKPGQKEAILNRETVLKGFIVQQLTSKNVGVSVEEVKVFINGDLKLNDSDGLNDDIFSKIDITSEAREIKQINSEDLDELFEPSAKKAGKVFESLKNNLENVDSVEIINSWYKQFKKQMDVVNFAVSDIGRDNVVNISIEMNDILKDIKEVVDEIVSDNIGVTKSDIDFLITSVGEIVSIFENDLKKHLTRY